MPIINLFSRRLKNKDKQIADVYQYETLPEKLKVQIVHIVRDSIGTDVSYNDLPSSVFTSIYSAICRELGVFSLAPNSKSNFEAVFNYFIKCNDTLVCLDIIELTFGIIDNFVRENCWRFKQCDGYIQEPDSAIEELNFRFKESSVGYQFLSGEIVRVDSQFIHSETIIPILKILGEDPRYSGANQEFLSAHSHYRHGRYKETLVDCLKSFESLIKGICEKRGWVYKKTDNAKNLITICFEKNLIPSYMQNQFSSLRVILESGVPTVRNKEGGHGQGAEIVNVSEHLASYMIHLTATNLIFLSNCEKSFN
jgi:hypothetical protein